MSENGTKTFEKHDLSGSLFKNDRKEKEEHPDYTGYIVVEGKEYWLSGWKKTSQRGEGYVSLAFRAKVASGEGGEEII